MRSGKKKFLIIALSILLLLGGGVWGVYYAARQTPEFYSASLEQPSETARDASYEMRRQVTALASDTQRTGRWSETFTAAQINGWLSVDLVEKHGGALPPGVSDPRVSITADEARIGCQFDEPWPNMVYSIAIEPYIAAPNVLAVRFINARAGLLPMPLGRVIKDISDGAAERGLRLEWQQDDGDPVLLLPLDQLEDSERYVLESVELVDGAIRFSGHTMSKEEARASREEAQAARETQSFGPTAQAADSSADQQNRQR